MALFTKYVKPSSLNLMPRFSPHGRLDCSNRLFSASGHARSSRPTKSPDGSASLAITKDVPGQNGIKPKLYQGLLQRCQGGTFPLNERRLPNGIIYYRVVMGQCKFNVPYEMIQSWQIERLPKDQRTLRMTLDVRDDGMHERAYAKLAILGDDAARLGIRVSMDGFEPIWLSSDKPSSVAVANGLVDFMTGKVTRPLSHNWGASRFPVFSSLGSMVSSRSWDQCFKNPSARQQALIAGVTDDRLVPRWTLAPRGERLLSGLRASTVNKEELKVLDFANDYWRAFGFIPGGIFCFDKATQELELWADAVDRMNAINAMNEDNSIVD